MAAKALVLQPKVVEEFVIQNEAVSLCLIIHRRKKTMRVIDFRAGPTNAKRNFVRVLAKREGVEKIYTLVERDEVGTWLKMGFEKEGNIPGFYKRSDAFLLGHSLLREPVRSETRIAIRDENTSEDSSLDSASHNKAERTLVRAKKLAKDLSDRAAAPVKLSSVGEADIKKAVSLAIRSGRALTAFEPFGRDVERSYFLLTARGGFEWVTSVESQSCFGNAFLEVLTSPRSESERLVAVSALEVVCERLYERQIVSCFSLAPSDDLGLATAYVANGFRRTGLLLDHLTVGGERKDAIIFSRRLANPGED